MAIRAGESRRGFSTPRRRGWSTVIGLLAGCGLFVALAFGVLAVSSYLWQTRTPGFATLGSYLSTPLGESRPVVLKRIGTPQASDQDDQLEKYFAALGPIPPGRRCDFYVEADSIMDPGVMRFCYVGDRLMEKASYDMEGQFAQILCAWTATDRTPTCQVPGP